MVMVRHGSWPQLRHTSSSRPASHHPLNTSEGGERGGGREGGDRGRIDVCVCVDPSKGSFFDSVPPEEASDDFFRRMVSKCVCGSVCVYVYVYVYACRDYYIYVYDQD